MFTLPSLSVSFTENPAVYLLGDPILVREQKPNATFLSHAWRKHQALTHLVRELLVEKYAIFRPHEWLLGGLIKLNVVLQLVFMEWKGAGAKEGRCSAAVESELVSSAASGAARGTAGAPAPR